MFFLSRGGNLKRHRKLYESRLLVGFIFLVVCMYAQRERTIGEHCTALNSSRIQVILQAIKNYVVPANVHRDMHLLHPHPNFKLALTICVSRSVAFALKKINVFQNRPSPVAELWLGGFFFFPALLPVDVNQNLTHPP